MHAQIKKRWKENFPENIMFFVLGKQVCQPIIVTEWDWQYLSTTPIEGYYSPIYHSIKLVSNSTY